ncbi:aminotransferase class IV [Amycolatopsis keratiniphila]|uniref:aminotransferase class IV n=1 Tax=Amycolatopsis keratiniphila TaxID=129921 RepID=UPI00087969DA|nr:aminotransferase class IV [Amycolatopsis keratiniphila]OLZ45900.1 hypothetical protein BS330_38350 [Amycolatopsis keratiniphila subsp. nogabecina]SDU12979.1 Amino-transferase class IV [Amycolatopsis keratiniphila]
MKLEINGAPARSEDLAGAFGYGHFTAMQVRDGKVRGLDVHLRRLVTSTRRMFGSDLDTDAVRAYVRQAIQGEDALSVRVLIFSCAMDWSDPGAPAAPDVLVRTGPPREHEMKPVASVDDVELSHAPETSRILAEAYDSNPWDEIY